MSYFHEGRWISAAAYKELRQREEYEKLMGRPPPELPDHPLRWQWDYEGNKDERARLAAILAAHR